MFDDCKLIRILSIPRFQLEKLHIHRKRTQTNTPIHKNTSKQPSPKRLIRRHKTKQPKTHQRLQTTTNNPKTTHNPKPLDYQPNTQKDQTRIHPKNTTKQKLHGISGKNRTP